jgi:hypothetical protein
MYFDSIHCRYSYFVSLYNVPLTLNIWQQRASAQISFAETEARDFDIFFPNLSDNGYKLVIGNRKVN